MAKLSADREDIKETEAIIQFETEKRDGDEVSYSWEFYDSSGNNKIDTSNKRKGSFSIDDLKKGKSYKIYAEVVIVVSTKHEEIITNEDGSQTTKEYWTDKEIYEDDHITIYTHPGSFEIGAEKDKLIKDVLNEDNIDNWITHFQKVYHWFEQDNEDYEKTDSLKIPEDKIISAKWFNACMDAMRTVGHDEEDAKYVKGAINDPPGDLITAEAINRMNFSGIK